MAPAPQWSLSEMSSVVSKYAEGDESKYAAESNTAALSEAVAAALYAAAAETNTTTHNTPHNTTHNSINDDDQSDSSLSSSSKTASPACGPAASPCGSESGSSSVREESWLMQLDEDSVRTELIDAKELDVLMDSPEPE